MKTRKYPNCIFIFVDDEVQSKRDTINVYMSEEERVYIGDVSFDYKKRGLQVNLAYTYAGENWCGPELAACGL